MNELEKLATEYGTDKAIPHNYTTHYFEHLRKYQLQPVKFLEMGVYEGASMKMWEDYFTIAQLTGLDISPDCKQFETRRTKIYIGNQKDIDFMQKLVAERGPFDVIIDDAGHRTDGIIQAFEMLWPTLAPGGIYVIEDLRVSYEAKLKYGGRHDVWTSAMEYLKGIVDTLHKPGVRKMFKPKGLHDIIFATGICFLRKKKL